MGERKLDLLLRFLRQNRGALSKRARSAEFAPLTDHEAHAIEIDLPRPVWLTGNVDDTSATKDDVAPAVVIRDVSKTYASGFQALKRINLEIRRGEIFALLGPNGAGKTTLISIVCGIVTPSTGTVTADGHDIVRDYRAARSKIGLVPQELTTDAFETVWHTVSFSRGLFGKPRQSRAISRRCCATCICGTRRTTRS